MHRGARGGEDGRTVKTEASPCEDYYVRRQAVATSTEAPRHATLRASNYQSYRLDCVKHNGFAPKANARKVSQGHEPLRQSEAEVAEAQLV